MPTQFLRKPFKTVCIDTVLFFAMFALVGHITINYWERYTIQNELYSMKHSLHTLKDHIGNIGKAYDTLHIQLKGVIREVNKKQTDTPQCRKKEKIEAKCKAEYNLNKNRRDFQVQTVTTKSNKMALDVLVGTDNKEIYGHEHKATGPKGTNASTNTKNPPKSTGTTPLDIPYDNDYRRNDLDCQRSNPDDRHNDHDYRHNNHDHRHNKQDYRHNDHDYRHHDKDYHHSKIRYKDFNDHCTRVCHGMADRHEEN